LPFKKVLFVYNTIDDFVMTNLASYNKRRIVSAEAKDLDLAAGVKKGRGDKEGAGEKDDEEKKGGEEAAAAGLSDSEVTELGDWLVATFPGKLASVRATKRLKSSPAIVTDHESGALRRMMRMVEQKSGGVGVSEIGAGGGGGGGACIQILGRIPSVCALLHARV